MKARVRYAKLGKVRFTSHRDTARHWERALRKAGVRVNTSAGFSPRPKLAFGLALPTGGESVAEYLDIDLVDQVADPLAWSTRISAALPVGYRVLAVGDVVGKESLQEAVLACIWWMSLRPEHGVDLDARVQAVVEATSLPLARERKGVASTDDVRPAIEWLAVERGAPWGECGVRMRLATAGRGVRPSEVAALLAPGVEPTVSMARLVRTGQLITHDGHRREMLPLAEDDTDAELAAVGHRPGRNE